MRLILVPRPVLVFSGMLFNSILNTATSLNSLFRAVVRAALKNTGVSIWSSLIQIALTGDPVWSYDIMAGTVVVELPELEQPE